MIVHLSLFGYLRDEYRKDPGREKEFAVTLPEGSTVGDLLGYLAIPQRELMLVINPEEREKVLTINDAQGAWESTSLKERSCLDLPFSGWGIEGVGQNF